MTSLKSLNIAQFVLELERYWVRSAFATFLADVIEHPLVLLP